MSTTATIGIAIALVFAVLFAVATIVFAILWRKRGKLLRELENRPPPIYQMDPMKRRETRSGSVKYEIGPPQPVRYPMAFVSELDGNGTQTK